jgi:hypothetical protein
MSTVTNIRASAPALPEIVGYVEAATAERILGWAWAPATPEVRTNIELRLADEVVVYSVADIPRADLASNGIGDGRHAYDLTIPPELRSRAAELRVFARAGEGEAFPIGAPPVADALADQVTKLVRGVDMLLGSQRLIHRNLQTALAGNRDPDSEGVAAVLMRMTELQAATETKLSEVETFVVRLDEHLSKLAAANEMSPDMPKRMPRAAVWALGVSGIALAVSVAGLVRSLGG